MTLNFSEQTTLDFLKQAFIERVPFHQLMGFTLDSTPENLVRVRCAMKPELIGNYTTGILHGGVIAAVLDAAGGLAAFLALFKKLGDMPLPQKYEHIMKVATVDMRIDFLRPAKGAFFIATAAALKCGKKISMTQMQLHDERQKLVSAGSATYIHGNA